MPTLSITTLGPLAFTLGDKPLTNFRSEKVRGLFIHLLLEANRPLHREALAALLWPNVSDKSARINLRVALFHLRQSLNRAQPGLADSLLEVSTRFIRLRFPVPEAHMDMAVLQNLLESVWSHAHSDELNCPHCQTNLQNACDLYTGPLLEGFYLAEANPFDEWLALKREVVQQTIVSALQTLTEIYLAQSAFSQAATCAARWVAILPWDEPAHRTLMRALALSGRRTAALAQYELCHRLLQTELGVAPEAGTTALYAQIEQGAIKPPPATPLLEELTVSAPTALSEETGRFLQLLARSANARCAVEIDIASSDGGDGGLWLARGLAPGGKLMTLKNDLAEAETCHEQLAALRPDILLDSRLASADLNLDLLMDEPACDFILLNTPAAHCEHFYQWAIQHVRPGGLIVAQCTQPSNSADNPAWHAFHQRVAEDPRALCSLYPGPTPMLVITRLN
jgi:DNA-binding SARP family transcriptional activator